MTITLTWKRGKQIIKSTGENTDNLTELEHQMKYYAAGFELTSRTENKKK